MRALTASPPAAMPVRLLLAGCMAVVACGGDAGTTPPDTARRIEAAAALAQTAQAGSAVPEPPSVRVVNSSGQPVAGVAVSFSVAAGGGSVASATPVSDAAGIASAGSWTLGQVAGVNTLTASVAGAAGSPVTFTATAAAGPPSVMVRTTPETQSARSRSAVAVAPAVRVTDGFDNPVAGVQVTFAVTSGGTLANASAITDAAGAASAGSWTLGRAGMNAVTATAAVAGLAGSAVLFSATAQEVVISPGTDTTLAGVIIVTRFVVPAGRTVTATGPLTIIADSTVNIAGTLTGACVPIAVRGEQLVTVTGTVSNGCDASADGQPLTIIGEGGYLLDGAEIITGGTLRISNDSTLLTTFAGAAGTGTGTRTSAGGVCDFQNSTIRPQPQRVRDGADGQHGAPGASAREWALLCRGDLRVLGNVKMHGQDGGNGGIGTHLSIIAAVASGGSGGFGGIVRIRATGIVRFSGAGNRIETGLGGHGGSARATAGINEAGPKAPSAEADGGGGGAPGRLDLRGDGGLQVTAPIEIFLGLAGNGGDAVAIAARGRDAMGIQPAQAGGNAEAIGGGASSTPQEALTPIPNVTGAELVIMLGGAGGRGGNADARAGDGGNGSETFPDGGAGGAATAQAADGGASFARDWQNTVTGLGGDGGIAIITGGNGGNGWNDCVPGNLRPGGAGGSGGTMQGRNGRAGLGSTAGVDGFLDVVDAGNGGRGGNGSGPGVGGAAGTHTLVAAGVNAGPFIDNSFSPGDNGAGCTATITGVVLRTQPTIQPLLGIILAVGNLQSTTGEDGRYRITGVAPGSRTVSIVGGQPPGLNCGNSKTVEVAAGEELEVNFDCLPVVEQGAVQGQLMMGEQPVANATVSMGEATTVTDINGFFTFGNLVFATYLLRVVSHPAWMTCAQQQVIVNAALITLGVLACNPITFNALLTRTHRHFIGFSEICLAIATGNPLLAGAPYSGQVSGGVVEGDRTFQGTLDAQGAAFVRRTILTYASYIWAVNILGRSFVGSQGVGSGAGTCTDSG
jgi:hypothetical protein